MASSSRPPEPWHPPRTREILGLFLLAMGLGACAGGPAELPDPRPLVIRSGARLYPAKERVQEINSWFRPELENIEQDPSFMIETVNRDTPAYPWESLLIVEGDTARIGLEVRQHPDARTPYEFYAHLHLMKDMGRLEEFLPAAADEEGFLLERAILARVSDVWLLGRSVFNAAAYEPLEELMYSNENGYLEAFILTARGDDFAEERQRWLQEDPEAMERYRTWFVGTFDREPPGMREEKG